MKLLPDKRITVGDAALDFAAAFALFALVTIVLFAPALPHLSRELLGPPEDNFVDLWNVWYVTVAADTRHFFETNLLGFPEGQSLIMNAFAWPQIAVIAVLTKFAGTDHATLVLLQNIFRLLSFPMAGALAFLLVHRLTGNRVGGLVGAFVYAFSPWHVGQALHHANVSEIGYIALFVFAYLEALESRSKAWLLVAILAWVLASLSMFYFLFYIAFFVMFHASFVWVHDRQPPQGWNITLPLITTSATLVLLLPLLVPMLLASTAKGAYLGGWNTFVVDLSAFFVPPPTHFLGAWTQSYFDKFINFPWEGAAYIGIANFTLLAALFFYRRNKKDVLIRYVLCGTTLFAVLSLGLQLHIGGYNTLLPMPDVLLWKTPVLANLRAPSRFFVMVSLFLAIGMGYAVSVIMRKFERRQAQFLSVFAIALIVIDFWPARIPMSDAVCPADFAIVRDDPEQGFGVLTVPFNYAAADWAMFGQTCHGRPIVQFNLSRVLRPSLVTRLEQHDMARQKQQLLQARVKYIILIPQRPGTILRDPVDARSAPYFATYRVLARQPMFAILEVYRGAAPSLVRPGT